MSDPEVMRYWSTLPHQALSVTEAFVASTIADVLAGVADEFIVERLGAVIGKVCIRNDRELGMFFARQSWGQGYATEAVCELLKRSFDRGLTEIEADIDPRNERSLRLLLRLGFQVTGSATKTFLLGDEWADSMYLKLHHTAFVDAAGQRQQ